MKVVVLRHDEDGPLYNPRFLSFATHYGFKPWACLPRRARTKGKVERRFDFVEKNLLNGRTFCNLAHLNEVTATWLTQVADVRLHWPVCEGIQTTAVLLRLTGDPHWERWYRRLWDHAARWFIDERGTWLNELDDDMRQGDKVWPGRPDVYHCGGALTLPLDI